MLHLKYLQNSGRINLNCNFYNVVYARILTV